MTEQSNSKIPTTDPSSATGSAAPATTEAQRLPTPVTDMLREKYGDLSPRIYELVELLETDRSEALRLLRAFRVLEGANKTMGPAMAKKFMLQWLSEIDAFLKRMEGVK